MEMYAFFRFDLEPPESHPDLCIMLTEYIGSAIYGPVMWFNINKSFLDSCFHSNVFKHTCHQLSIVLLSLKVYSVLEKPGAVAPTVCYVL